MDASNIRNSTINLADSITTAILNLESQTIGRVLGIETDITINYSQTLQVMSKLYSDILDLVLESNDLAKIFYIKAKLEAMASDTAQSQEDIAYRTILQTKLDSLNTNLDPSC